MQQHSYQGSSYFRGNRGVHLVSFFEHEPALFSDPRSSNMQAFGPTLVATHGNELVSKVIICTRELYHLPRRSPPEATKIVKSFIQRQPHAIHDANFP